MIRPALAVIALSLLTLTGCGGSGVNPTLEGRQDPYASGQIMFADTTLRQNTAVQAPRVARGEHGGILHVTVPIRNTSSKQLIVDYRATWFDRNGSLLNQTTWSTKTLTPKVPDQVTINSMGPQAADFQIDFRRAK
jgi:uncharacterized protein YcfL